jgi:hypothetical protein
MNNNHRPAPKGAGSFAKIMFIAIAGLLIPPSLLVYGVMELLSGSRA